MHDITTRTIRLSGCGVLLCSLIAGSGPSAREVARSPSAPLTFADRLAAQSAIEAVYYRHRIGTTLPFERAVPGWLLERQVRTYLRQSVALEEYWHTPVTERALRSELERILRHSQLPDRLQEIRVALGNDDRLLMETLVRSRLVDRLTRAFLAADERVQEPARREAQALRLALVDGHLDPEVTHSRRTSMRVIRKGDGRAAEPTRPDTEGVEPTLALDPAQYDSWRRLQPAQPGQVGPVIETGDAFEVSVILGDEGTSARLALYRVPRITWDDWWAREADRFDESRLREVPDDPESGEGSETIAVRLSGLAGALASTCGPPQDLWSGGHTEATLVGRADDTAVWTGSEMIIWGGNFFGYLNTGARYDPSTDTWKPVSTVGAPTARSKHSAVWTGSEMIVYGGEGSSSTTSITGGRYDPIMDAWQSVPSGSSVSGGTALWTGSLMIVWRGDGIGGRYNPATNTWLGLAGLGGPSRSNYSAVWTGTEMIVWGGSLTNTGGRYNPTTDTWTLTSTVGAPSPRQGHTAVWTGSVMIVWGSDINGDAPTGGRYDPAADQWAPTRVSGAPATRSGHTAVWTGSRMIVWGGTDQTQPPPSPLLATGAQYDPAADTWASTSLVNAPSARRSHNAVWTGSRMIVWGGMDQTPPPVTPLLITGGRYDPVSDSWTPTRSSRESPQPRTLPSYVWTGAELILWGGAGTISGGRYDAITDSWSPTTTLNAPSPVQGSPAVWTGSEMIVWGGSAASAGRYNPITDTWSSVAGLNAPSNRGGHTVVWTGSEMIVWGGTGSTLLNTGGRYDPGTDSWTATPVGGAPEARKGHSAVWTGDEMIVWGGNVASGTTATGARLDPASGVWTPVSTTNAPSARAGHAALWTGSRMIVWGAAGDASGGRYDPASDSWAATSLVDPFYPFDGHSTVWDGSEMIVWGGIYSCGPLCLQTVDIGARYDPVADVWTPTTTTGAPADRYDHLAVWTGRAMIVWGGEYFSGGDNGHDRDDRRVPWYGGLQAAPHDLDGDGVDECLDCDDGNAAAWSRPGETRDLIFVDGSGTLGWSAPAIAGGVTIRYDTIRASNSSDFVSSATCIESDDAGDRVAIDPASPVPNGIFYYLVRAENGCPGGSGSGSLGTTSSGTPRVGRVCP